jgi:two-component system CheB/CheR fusion protein
MNLPKHTQNFPIVGIGASAGGLNAFKRMVEAIPEDSGMAYVLVQHLDPKHESLLPELLSKMTRIPIYEITDQINVVPDTIYIIPENKMVTATDGVLQLSPRDNSKLNLPIDLFFTSLAAVHKTYAVGVILSGTAFDGTEGLKAIKEAGGITFAQDLDTADFPGMPLSAINAEVVDFVLPPESIPGHIMKVKKSYELNHANSEADEVPREDEELYKRIIAILRSRTGHDFSNYKQATIRRRIARRMVATETQTLGDYVNFLRHSKKEQDALFNDVLIPVTYFFRDHKIFESLPELVFPVLVKNKTKSDAIRVWVAGCSTGEEAYSLAICLHEYFSEKHPGTRIQIFASDLSEHVIARARTGVYSRQDVKMISAARLNEFFIKTGNEYQVASVIRDMCVFAVHNFLKDPPFAKMDLISCRNVLIYMNVLFQKKALTSFHYALNPGGILWLGKSESVSTAADLFAPLNKQFKLYSRSNGPGSFMRVSLVKQDDEVFSAKNQVVIKTDMRTDFLKSAEGILFSKYTPPAVIINGQMDIAHFHGDLSKVLLPPRGKPSLNLLKMARHELVFELRNIFHKSRKTQASVVSEKIPLSVNDEHLLIMLEIIPLSRMDEEHYLIIFNPFKVVTELPGDKTGSAQKIKATLAEERIKELETELNKLREDIRSVTEDQEIFNEELQSANEELLSSSEELQSVNEELETSKEELQASNEELQGLNQELLDRQEQLFAARSYSEAIVGSINTPILILDKRLRLKTANTTFYNFFNTNEYHTDGKLIFEVNNHMFDIPELRELLEKVIPNKAEFKDFELTLVLPSLGEKILLLSARQLVHEKPLEELVLLVVQDVTDSRMAQKLKESEERFRLATELTGLGTWELNLTTNRIYNSSTIRNLMNIDQDECSREEFLKSIHPEDMQRATSSFEEAVTTGRLFFEARVMGLEGKPRWIRVNGQTIVINNLPTRLLGTVMDVSDQKTHLLQLEESEERFKGIADSAPVLLWLADTEAKLYFFNKGWLEFTGRTMEQESGEGWLESVHPEDREELKKIYKTSFDERKDFFAEYRLKRKDGTYRWISVHGTPRFTPENGFKGFVGGGIDITDQKIFADTLEKQVQERTEELKKSHESLQERNLQLERSNNELASFSYIASHDLQEPLRRIRAFSDRILENEKTALSATAADYFSRINKAAKQMTQLIHDLLEYSQVNSQQVVTEPVDLNEVVDTVLATLNSTLEEKNAKVEVSDLPVVKVLAIQFNRLFTNIITNAIKYSKPGVAPHIIINSSVVAGEDTGIVGAKKDISYWKITLKDNGIGFDPKYGQQIFEMFQRLHPKTEYEGTGIGLAICKKIVQNYNGFITAASEQGVGSTFDIYLPKED